MVQLAPYRPVSARKKPAQTRRAETATLPDPKVPNETRSAEARHIRYRSTGNRHGRRQDRPGTVSAKLMADDVPPEEKKRRLEAVNSLQEQIVSEINARLLGRSVEILVEEKQKGRWKGRTRTNKLVFFEDDSGRNWQGQLVELEITWTGPWSLRGALPGQEALTPTGEQALIQLVA